MKKLTSIIGVIFFISILLTACGGNPTACDCFKKLGDKKFTKKCNEYVKSLSKKEKKEWKKGLKDCR